MRRAILICGLAIGALAPDAATAHPHQVETPGTTQVIANGQNHAPFVDGVSCGGDPAAYGLETAHHGPDPGTPGRADEYYATLGTPPTAARPSAEPRPG